MPSTSAKQAKFMRAVAHSPKFAKKVGVPQSVGKDFNMADKKMQKYNKGGMPKEPVTGGSGTVPLSPERKKFLDQMRKQNEEAQKQGKREGRAAPGHKAGGKIMKKSDKAGRALVKKSADTMGRAMKKYAKGGSIDGVAVKGKTKAKHVKMAAGGMFTDADKTAALTGASNYLASQPRAKGSGAGMAQRSPTRIGRKKGGKC